MIRGWRPRERVERAESRIENEPATQEGSARPTADTSGWRTLPLAPRLPRDFPFCQTRSPFHLATSHRVSEPRRTRVREPVTVTLRVYSRHQKGINEEISLSPLFIGRASSSLSSPRTDRARTPYSTTCVRTKSNDAARTRYQTDAGRRRKAARARATLTFLVTIVARVPIS